MATQHDYPCIKAWDRMMGSYDYHIGRNIEQARLDGAPQDAIYKDGNDGHWHRLCEVRSAHTQWYFIQNHPDLVERFTDWKKEPA